MSFFRDVFGSNSMIASFDMERPGLSVKSFPTQRRGGAMDPGFSSFDAAVDVEMFLSEYGDDDTAERKRALMPQKCQLFSGRLEDGQMATAAETCGDGTCSLHSLWGSVMWTPAGNTYFCEDAREKLCEAMPIDVTYILNSPCGAAVRCSITCGLT